MINSVENSNINIISPKPKYRCTTRHLAALDFLLNIPMQRERAIRQTGAQNALKAKSLDENVIVHNMIEHEDALYEDTMTGIANVNTEDAYISSHMDSAAGKKLKGPPVTVTSLPIHFRYSMQRISDQSALVRQWEEQVLNKGGLVRNASNQVAQPILASRIFFSRAQSYPCAVFSVVKYDAGEEKAKIKKMKADDQKGLEVFDLPQRDWRGFSYKPLFKPVNEDRSWIDFEHGYICEPNLVDDPELIHGSHRYVLPKAAATGPIISSIILYVNKTNLKKSLNEEFRERHPNLPPSLTLSKIRNIKKQVIVLCQSAGIEASTAALAVISFERLCIKGLVTKVNRKLTMAVCLLLAYKFNEFAATPLYHKTLNLMFAFFDRDWDLPKKEVFDAEFGAYVHLGFSLHLPYTHVFYVYSRLLKLVHDSSKHYLGDEMHESYLQDIIGQETAYAVERDAQSKLEKEMFLRQQSEQLDLEQEQEHAEQQLKQSNDHHQSSDDRDGMKHKLSKLTEQFKMRLPGRFIAASNQLAKPEASTPTNIVY
eukprot:gene25959-34559_t